MRWLAAEYVLKGIFLGLLTVIALQDPGWPATGRLALFLYGGLLAGLLGAGVQKLRQGYRVKGRYISFILFLLLESPDLVYAGVLAGALGAALSARHSADNNLLVRAMLGGALLGLVFWVLRNVADRRVRLGLSFGLAATLVGAALAWIYRDPATLHDAELRTTLGVRLLVGIPIFYLLTLAGRAEESEVEIGAVCATLGLATWMLAGTTPAAQVIAFGVPVALFFLYTTRVLPGLRVFKHTVRAISYGNIGRYRPALVAFRRALQLDPHNALARESLWGMHREMDLDRITRDPDTMALLDLDLCLERAGALLLEATPGPDRLAEAHHLLDLVLNQRPALRPTIDYWRAVAHTHQRHYDLAAQALEHLLDPGAWAPAEPYRAAVLSQAWQLALTLHPEMKRRVGVPQLDLPGRRMEAIAAVERQLAATPQDPAAWDLKRVLYGDLSEAEYRASAGPARSAADFDHAYAEQLGLALVNDPARWQRGVEYLRLAARGLPAQAPSLFLLIAQAFERAGQKEMVWDYYELAKRAGQALGHKNLGDKDRQEYFAAVKLLAERARAAGDLDAAIDSYRLFAESERSGLETLRVLADLHEKKGDVIEALRITDQALVYDAKDQDLLERKDRYYYSVMPEHLRLQAEAAAKFFDVGYCLRKAKSLLDYRDADLELIDWAQHLAELAQIIQPEGLAARVLRSRALRRRGESEAAQALLEEVYHHKPEKFVSGAEEDAWFQSCRLLGEMYLYELNKPDLAVPCLNDFRKSSKSGADTLYKLGQAYEQVGDRARAKKCYENVTAYDGHPLAMDAQDALYRLQST
jgi:tetratricopeptide (TPR) repeat protein